LRHFEFDSAKVLAELLVLLVNFGILPKEPFPEVPPRVEYCFTPFGSRVVDVLDELEWIPQEFGNS